MQNPQFDPGPKFYRGGPDGILLLHGYTATPVEVSLLAEFLNQRGYTVSCPLLPGHGTRIEDLHRTTWKEWAAHAESALQSLIIDCNRCVVGGISLGGLISLYLAALHPEIKGTMLFSPAVYVGNRFAFMAHGLKYFVKALPKIRKRTDKSIINERWQGYTKDSLPAVSQLLNFQRHVRKKLPDISQPIIIFQGKLDETIRPEGAEEIFRRVNSGDKELIWLEESRHSLLLDFEWEKVAHLTSLFLSKVLASE
jgi:carboxylesterase